MCDILDLFVSLACLRSVDMSANRTKWTRSRILSWVVNLAGVLAFVLILYLGGVDAWRQILGGDWRYLVVGMMVSHLWNRVAAYRWMLIANRVVGRKISAYRYFFTYQMIGMLIGQVMPITVGMLAGRPVALSLSQEVPLRRSALSVFLDKLFDLLLALLLVLPVAFYLADWIGLPLAAGIIGVVVAAGAFLIGWQYERAIRLVGQVGSRLAQPLARVPVVGPRVMRRLPRQLERLSNQSFIPNRLALRAFLLTCVMYTLLSLRMLFVARTLNLDIPWHLLAMGVAITQLAIAFSITPGSLGFLEAGWAAVLGLAGMSLGEITTFVIARRAYFLLFTAIDTLIAFAWIRESPARLFRAVLSASGQPTDPGEAESGSVVPSAGPGLDGATSLPETVSSGADAADPEV